MTEIIETTEQHVQTSRKLATIQRIAEVKPIEGADKICSYGILGWYVTDQIGKYKVGDLVVYIEADAFVPNGLAPFLTKEGKEPKVFNGVPGERLRTVKFKGVLSQGLLLPVSTVFGLPNDTECDIIYMDVTGPLGIQLYEAPIPACLAGQVRGNFPSGIPKTEATRIQNLKQEQWEDLKTHEVEITEKVHGCFLRDQYIETFDGTTVKIGDIVNKGVRPDLIGVNEYGEVVPCKITEVFNNGIKSDWLDVSFNHWNRTKVGGRGKLRTTPNHKIFLKDMSEVNASAIKQGDEILTTEIQYCEKGIHYMKSSLLGDGHVGGNGHFSYNESHATKYGDYLNYIESIFEDVGTSSRLATSGYGSEIKHIKVFTTSQLREMREDWYGTGKKALPEDISWIDDFSVAKWYMDDGSLCHADNQNDRAAFATNTFSKEDVIRLADKLKELYSVDVTVFESKGWRIRVNWCKGSIDRLWKAIAKHIPQSMRYKLPEKFRNEPFEYYQKVKYVRKLIPVVVNNVTLVENTKRNFPSGQVGYDIETTTHNYFCGGVLVHNSSCTMILDTEGSFHVCSRNLDLKPDENNSFWKAAYKYDVENKLRAEEWFGLAIQGELIGEGINGNQYKVGLDFLVFNIYDTCKKKYLSYSQRMFICEALGLKHVPVVLTGSINQGLTVQDALGMAEGISQLNKSKREGWVIKSQKDTGIIVKVISNAWLLKNDE